MSEFIQLHILASYPPSNLNRDDLGRPKTAIMGGKQRLRVSSQSLKRAWRQSDFLQEALAGHMGIRTKEMGTKIIAALTSGRSLNDMLYQPTNEPSRSPVDEKKAKEWAMEIAGKFGKCKKNSAELEQLVHFSPVEIDAVDALLSRCVTSGEDPSDEDLMLLRNDHAAADIAMFGRMLASSPAFNTEAAVQVSHAITVHDVVVEDDYFTAVDDLNDGSEDQGSAHIGEFEFASGLFYIYVCVNRDLLIENLQDDEGLANRALSALTEATLKVGPTGKQASFASRAYASYVLAERGDQQPRSLAVSFLTPVKGGDMLADTIAKLEETRQKMETVYGPCCEATQVMNAYAGEGSLSDILKFVSVGS